MKRLFIIFIALGLSMTATAQTLDMTVSFSLPLTSAGAALDQMFCSVQAKTVIQGWQMSGQLDLALMPMAMKQLILITQGEFAGFTVVDQSIIDPKGTFRDQTTVSTQYAGLTLSATFAYSYTLLPEFTFSFDSVTIGASTRTLEGVLLASATTMTLQGFAKQAFTMGFSVQGVSITRKTELTSSGLSQEIWQMALRVQEWSLTRTTVYTLEGFTSDTLSISRQFRDYLFVGTTVFSKAGWTQTLTIGWMAKGLSLGLGF
ncbi:MAG: hypothetical protein NZ930_06095 [Candidatus Bipolaricaulota bacterium]|nr:hypothetical protein [Candidatus Bipolaricaulota bacterium]MDW8030243.1 hypothetical protein [Candidatus Bipolaricaulota bacterium]